MAGEQNFEISPASAEQSAFQSANVEASSKALTETMTGHQFNKALSATEIESKEDAFFNGGELDFGAHADIYGGKNDQAVLLAQAPKEVTPSVAQNWSVDYTLERARQKNIESSHNKFDGKNATNNEEFLDMFLCGSGNDKQIHSERGKDAMLEAFIKSPGAESIRQQYAKENYPVFTDKLGYGTFEAFKDTMLPKVENGSIKLPDYYSEPGVHVGGFGNPPKDNHPWAKTTATRCDENGKANKDGDHVQFQVINLAGKRSWFYHLPQFADKPIGEKGTMRTIVEVFRWTEPLPKTEKQGL